KKEYEAFSLFRQLLFCNFHRFRCPAMPCSQIILALLQRGGEL
ncbi:MAG: hypothetical protein ACI83P_001960, partial [Janthinobacterium sp.]